MRERTEFLTFVKDDRGLSSGTRSCFLEGHSDPFAPLMLGDMLSKPAAHSPVSHSLNVPTGQGAVCTLGEDGSRMEETNFK